MRFPNLALLLLLGTTRLTNVSAENFAFDTSAAQAIYPDPRGYVILQQTPNPNSNGTALNLTQFPVDAAGVKDSAREVTRDLGIYTLGSSWSGTCTMADLLVNPSGLLCPVVVSSYCYGFGGTSSDCSHGTVLGNRMFTGDHSNSHYESFPVRMGIWRTNTYTYQGFLTLGADGGPASMSLCTYDPATGATTYSLSWNTGTPTVVPAALADGTYVMQAAGLSRAGSNLGIAIGKLGTEPKLWRISDAGVTTEAAIGYATTPLAITESATGEVVSLSVDAGRLVARSSTAGSTDLGASTLAAPLTSWFDGVGNYHALSGSLIASTTVPVHVWRSAAGAWQVTDVASYLDPTATVVRVDTDITPGGALGIAVQTRKAAGDTIRLVRFLEGNWTNGVVATSAAGATFSDLAAGTIADGRFLVIYKTTSSAKSTSSWDVQALAGLTAADAGWELYR